MRQRRGNLHARLSVVRACVKKGQPIPLSFTVPVAETFWYATNCMRFKMRKAAYPFNYSAATQAKRCSVGAAF